MTENESQASIEIHAGLKELISKKTYGDANRASSAPQCVRKRWYKNHGYKGEDLQPRSQLVFRLGSLIELEIQFLIATYCVGEGKLYSEVDFGTPDKEFVVQDTTLRTYKQETLSFKIGDLEITAHPDGWGKRNSDHQWELIEIKSSATFGYDRFAAGETPDYIRQVHAVMLTDQAKTRRVRTARFFFYNKNTSHLIDRAYEFDDRTAHTVKTEYSIAAGDTIPDRPFTGVAETYYKKPTGRTILQWNCSYCDLVSECQTEYKRVIEKGKPLYIKESANG